MSFRLTLGSLLFFISFSIGCNIRINEKPPQKKSYNFKPGEKLGCLADALPVMSRFIKGNGQKEEVSEAWNCFGHAIGLYRDFVEGNEVDRYKARELASFFEQYFLKDVVISDRLLTEIMHLKQVFVGGEESFLTRDELTKLILFANDIKEISLDLLPSMKIFSMNWQLSGEERFNEDLLYFEGGNQALQKAALRLGDLINKNNQSYKFESFVALFEEMAKLYGEDWPFIAKMKEIMPLIYQVKKTMTGGPQDSIAANEWTRFALMGSRLYIQFLRIHLMSSNAKVNIYHQSGLHWLNGFVDDSTDLIEKVVETKDQSLMTFSELENLTKAVDEAYLLPESLTLKVLNDLLRTVLQKILVDPEKRIQGDLPQGLTKDSMNFLRQEFKLWLEGQQFFDDLFSRYSGGEATGSQIVKELQIQKSSTTRFELTAIFESPQSRSFDSRNSMVIRGENDSYKINSIDRINFARLLSRLIIRSYSMELSRVSEYRGVTLDEAGALFIDLKPIMVALGLLEEKNVKFAKSRFREANLFTARADGNQLASFIELGDLALHIFSGLKLDSFLRKFINEPVEGCREIEPKFIEVSCLTRIYESQMKFVFSSIPYMQSYMMSLPRSDGTFEVMMMNLLKAAGYIPEKEGLVYLGDAALVPHLMQYIETLIQRFDQDKDGILNNSEAMGAYPVFKDVLILVSGREDEPTLKALLAWIMEKGKPPETLQEKAQFLIYRKFPKTWNIQTDRMKLASILGFIAAAVNKPKPLVQKY